MILVLAFLVMSFSFFLFCFSFFLPSSDRSPLDLGIQK